MLRSVILKESKRRESPSTLIISVFFPCDTDPIKGQESKSHQEENQDNGLIDVGRGDRRIDRDGHGFGLPRHRPCKGDRCSEFPKGFGPGKDNRCEKSFEGEG